jgi:hypothetical protein
VSHFILEHCVKPEVVLTSAFPSRLCPEIKGGFDMTSLIWLLIRFSLDPDHIGDEFIAVISGVCDPAPVSPSDYDGVGDAMRIGDHFRLFLACLELSDFNPLCVNYFVSRVWPSLIGPTTAIILPHVALAPLPKPDDNSVNRSSVLATFLNTLHTNMVNSSVRKLERYVSHGLLELVFPNSASDGLQKEIMTWVYRAVPLLNYAIAHPNITPIARDLYANCINGFLSSARRPNDPGLREDKVSKTREIDFLTTYILIYLVKHLIRLEESGMQLDPAVRALPFFLIRFEAQSKVEFDWIKELEHRISSDHVTFASILQNNIPQYEGFSLKGESRVTMVRTFVTVFAKFAEMFGSTDELGSFIDSNFTLKWSING